MKNKKRGAEEPDGDDDEAYPEPSTIKRHTEPPTIKTQRQSNHAHSASSRLRTITYQFRDPTPPPPEDPVSVWKKAEFTRLKVEIAKQRQHFELESQLYRLVGAATDEKL